MASVSDLQISLAIVDQEEILREIRKARKDVERICLWRVALGMLFLCFVFFCLGAVAGYYTALLQAPRPAKVRYSYVDTVPPPCAMLPTRDLRHVCEWERARIK